MPPQRTSIVGREQEIEDVCGELLNEGVRLLTLTGVGGAGKTTLGQAVARELLQEFPEGVVFVDLTAIKQPELVATTIGQVLGIKAADRNPSALKEYLRGRKMLLVLDNFEQVLTAGPFIGDLLAAAPALKVLVTSRALLQLRGEREYVVPALAAPEVVGEVSAAELEGYGAVRLFLERARTVRANFEITNENAPTVARICAKLDGLPLAIELAAARVKVLSPQAILYRLDHRLKLLTGGSRDLPTRQQTMSSAIEWSYELLTEEEKRLFRRFAVFVGGLTFEAAEKVLGGDIDVLDEVTSLVYQSLIEAREGRDGDTRLYMLETVREYALDRLEALGEAEAMRKKHAAYFLSLAEHAEPQLQGAQPAECLSRMQTEYDNLCAALRWALANDPVTAARMAAAMRDFWVLRGPATDGLGILKEILEASECVGWTVRCKLLSTTGNLARFQGDYDSARKVYEDGLRQAHGANDLAHVSLFYRGLGGLALEEGDHAAALGLAEQALAAARESNDQFGIARSLNMFGDLARWVGEDERARPFLEEALAICRQVGNKYATSTILNNLAAAEYGLGDYSAAGLHFAEALQLAVENGGSFAGNRIALCYALDGFAALATRRGEADMAAKLAGAAERLRESANYNIEPPERRFRDTYMAGLRPLLSPAEFFQAYELGRTLKLEESIGLALGGHPPQRACSCPQRRP